MLRIEAEALTELLQRLDASFEQAVELLLACKGRVVVIGMGKSGLIGRKIAATFSSTGTPSVFLHPAEAVHGDLGMLMREDVVMAVSYGGETEEIAALLETIKRLGLRMISLTGHPKSTIGTASDVTLDVSVKRRGVLVEPRADGFDNGGHGHGRRAGGFVARPARIQSRRFRGPASGRTAGEETIARGKSDALG